MSLNRKRWTIVVALVLAAVAVEVGVRIGRRPTAGLLLINGGDRPIRNLAAAYGGVQVLVGDIEPGAMRLVRLACGPRDTVTIAFEQVGNAAPGAQLTGTELDQARRDGLRMALTFQQGQVVRFMEADEQVDDSPLGRIRRWLYDVLFATPATPRNGGFMRGWPW